MYEYIGAIVVGLMCIIIGILNTKGNVSMLHSYHRKRVKEADILPFGRLVGIGMMVIGAAITVAGVLSMIAYKTENRTLDVVGYVIIGIGLAVGLGFAFYAMKKYNKGIF